MAGALVSKYWSKFVESEKGDEAPLDVISHFLFSTCMDKFLFFIHIPHFLPFPSKSQDLKQKNLRILISFLVILYSFLKYIYSKPKFSHFRSGFLFRCEKWLNAISPTFIELSIWYTVGTSFLSQLIHMQLWPRNSYVHLIHNMHLSQSYIFFNPLSKRFLVPYNRELYVQNCCSDLWFCRFHNPLFI